MAVRVCMWRTGLLLRSLRTSASKRGFAEARPEPEGEDPSANDIASIAAKIQEDPYYGIAYASFPQKVTEILLNPVNETDIEIKPDGMIYLPEIKYRRILNQAFGPGGWAIMPRGETLNFQCQVTEGAQLITREYALYCQSRFVAQATGEHTFYSKSNLSYGKACESAKSNALMRCCKDLGIASELWDPQFIDQWKKRYASEVWCENVRTKEKKRLWRRKDNTQPFAYPWKEQRTTTLPQN